MHSPSLHGAVKRSIASFVLSVFFFAGFATPDAMAAAAPVSRLKLLTSSVELFYGSAVSKTYATAFSGVPLRARGAVGLAYSLKALQGWEENPKWNTPVTRGQAIRVLFALAQISPDTPSRAPFDDLQGPDVPLADRAVKWGMIAPLTPGHFGWERTLEATELPLLLQELEKQLIFPLHTPTPRAAPAVTKERRKRPERSTAPPVSRNRGTPKKTITVDAPVDATARLKPQPLPKSDLLSAIWGLIQAKYLYLDKIDDTEAGYALAEKMMSLLDDPYSTFLRPSSASSFQQQLQGELSGIGAQVEIHPQGGVLVVSPLAGSPALKAGVQPGDRITHVDGVSILELDLQKGVEKIRGPIGSTVTLTIERNGSTIEIKVVRAKITLPEIEVSLQDSVLVIKLYQFGERTVRDLNALLAKGMEQKPTGVVLDLRNNPGGLLDAAVSVLGHFLPENSIAAKIRSRNSTREEHTEGEPVIPNNLPVVIIVNKGSASASEIVAGALQDLKRATVLGLQTFGKGTVQEVVQFSTGESAKLTTGEWLTPNGRSIQKVGVTPDVKMEEEKVGSRDEWLLRAIDIVKAKTR